MTDYRFARGYNRLYDALIQDFFKSRGVYADSDLTFEKAESIERALDEKGKERDTSPPDGRILRFRDFLEPHEVLFLNYVTAWRRHPEERPSTLYFLERVYDGSWDLTFSRLEQLEKESLHGQEKVLLSVEEAGQEIVRFYKKYLTRQLETDLKRGAGSKELFKYLWENGETVLPHGLSVEEYEKRYHEEAAQLLAWSKQITSEVVTRDIEKVLDQHLTMPPEHLRRVSVIMSDNIECYCEHKSEWVTLGSQIKRGGQESRIVVSPARGDRLVEEGWGDIAFPVFFAKGKDAVKP